MNHRTDITENLPPKHTTNQDRINKYEVNTTRFRVKMLEIVKNLYCYRPKELARDLAALAFAADREAAINKIDSLQVENTTPLSKT